MSATAQLTAVDYHLPDRTVTNADLAQISPDWTETDILQKTGVRVRHVAGEGELASDLACRAAEKLLARQALVPEQVDFLIYVTQSPDQFMPASACILQSRLGLPLHCGAVDVNQGCSGYVYGLGLAAGLVESGQARGVLLLCGDTPSRFLAPDDLAVRTLFGDGGSASWITAVDGPAPALGPFVHGTDGRGAPNLYVQGGLCAGPAGQSPRMHMNGPEVFAFTMSAVPRAVRTLLSKAALTLDDVDLVVFHQANTFMLEHLRNKLKIPADRFVVAMQECGNTTSSSIPIALREAEAGSRLTAGMRVMLVGFGVGYSWSATLLRWPG